MRVYQDRLARLVASAIADGATRKGLSRFAWDVSGNCTEPKLLELSSRPAERRREHEVDWNRPIGRELLNGSERYIHAGGKGERFPLHLDMTVRCRRCEACRKQRRVAWSARAMAETRSAHRTWFGTLTLRPEEQHLAKLRAIARLNARAVSYDELTLRQQFAEHTAAIGGDITKWLKRVRKETGAPLRYLLVAEAHKSGNPHFHVLVHEMSPEKPVSWRALSLQWTLGFSKFNLVTETCQATYLCKYLSKDASARVRASVRYGQV